jgi:aryl-alcohol dehydrogenase-like predicted oxidoreductase
MQATPTMEYRNLGGTGLKVSVLGFGNMINYKPENVDIDDAIVKKCLDSGVNFFDTAELYADGTVSVMQVSVKRHSVGRS